MTPEDFRPLNRFTIIKYLNKDDIARQWYDVSGLLALFVLALVFWGIAFALFGDEIVGVRSQLFSLGVLFISAKIAGAFLSLFNMPPMVGMLLMGVLLKNIKFLNITDEYSRFTAVLRQLALVNIMLPAGLGLDAKALKRLKWMVLNLSIIPVAVEVVSIAAAFYFLMGFPWLWGILVGFCGFPLGFFWLLSPAVIIPCLFQLQDLGYGVDKGIHTLVIAAATINDIICIALFGIVIGILFSTGSVLEQVLQGPIVLAIGFSFGIVWGVICQFVPHNKNTYVTTLRTLMLGLGCILSTVGSDAIGYGGAGALGCIIAAFTASLGWRKHGMDGNNLVRANFVLLWKFFEPISFGLIGMEVNFDILEVNTVLWGILAMLVPLLLRIATSFLSTQFSNLNMKENIFVAVCWIPRATIQAALGPVALDLARQNSDEILEEYANTLLIVAVVSILLTSPIGAILIMQLGPRLLHRTIQEPNLEIELS